MATPNIVPRADSEGQLGTSSKYWAAAYIDFVYVGAGKIGRDADNLIDFSTDNIIKFRVNNGNELELDAGNLYPATDDGLALGYVDNGFSDLFLASGAVINFDDGNVILTHSNNALTLGDSDVMKFGTDGDFLVYHSGSNASIENYTGNLAIVNNADNKNITFRSDDGSGGVTAYLTLDGSQGFTTVQKNIRFEDGIETSFGLSDDMRIYHSGSAANIRNFTGDLTIEQNTDDGDIIFQSEDGSGGVTTYFTVDGSARDVVFSKDIVLNDNVNLRVGTGHDLQIYHDSTDSVMLNTNGNLFITSTATDKDVKFNCDNGAGGHTTYFYLDGSSATHDGSATTALYTNWPDNSRISLGTSHDFSMKHTGSDTHQENLTGDLYFTNYADDKDIIFKSDDGSGGVKTYLYLDGSTGGYVRIPDNGIFALGDGADLILHHDASNSYIINQGSGNLTIENQSDDGDIIFKSDDGSGGSTAYLTLDGGLGYTVASKSIKFSNGVSAAFGTTGNGHYGIVHDGNNAKHENFTGDIKFINYMDDADIIFQSDDGSGGVATYFSLDGGNEIVKFNKNIQLVDNVVLNLGSSNDLQLKHDGSNSYVQNTVGDLYIQNHADDKDIILRSDDGSGGQTAYLTLDGSATNVYVQKNLKLADNVLLQIGDSGDLNLNTDGSHGYISNVTGNLYIKNQADDADIIFQSDDGSGGIETYFFLDGSLSSGSPFTTFPDQSRAGFGTNNDLTIYHDGSNTYMYNNGGDLKIMQAAADKDLILMCDDGSGGETAYLTLDGGDVSTIVNTIKVLMPNLPTSDPSVAGQLWNSSGDLKISAG